MKKILSLVAATALFVSALGVAPLGVAASGKGDFNDDGVINTSDVRDMMLTTVNETAPTQKQMWWGDYNQNDAIDTTDARRVLEICIVSDGKTIDYANVTNTDWWGEKSVALLGDSISFGSGSEGELATYSYAGMIRNHVNKANGSTNYGFMPAYTTNWSPRSEEVCAWPTMTGGPGVTGNSGGWSETDDGNRLMYFGLTAYKQYASLTYRLKSQYNFTYVCVYYQTGPGYGQFVVATNKDGMGYDQTEVGASASKVYDCNNTVNETKRTGFFRVSDFTDGISINIVSAGDNAAKTLPVTICGLGFYNDISGESVTFEKYTRGGAMLTPLSDTVLEQAASAGTLILGLGYNDFFWGNAYSYSKEAFSSRINKLIEECNKNGTNVIVNDYLWSNYKTLATYKGYSAAVKADVDEKYTFFKSELRRFANETDGIYIDQEARWGQAIVDAANANDGVHPTNAGHEMLATAILEAMGLA